MTVAEKYVGDICYILDIEEPEISYDTSHFETEKTMAQVEPNRYTIYIRREYPDYHDFFFAAAHELRHLWQYVTDREKYFADYKEADKLPMGEYNSQPAEVDANAFAIIIMVRLFDFEPNLYRLSEENVELTKKRIREIFAEEDLDDVLPGKGDQLSITTAHYSGNGRGL